MRRLSASLLVTGTLAALVGGAAAAPPGVALTAHPRTAPAHVPTVDREVTFMADGTRTYGTLHVPAHPAGRRMPAALLLPGSGPTDRNGDQLPDIAPHTLAQLADVLGDAGVVTLRFDKYTTGQTGLGAYADDPGQLDYPAFVRQAAAAYRLLAAAPESDTRRLTVVGHSEGGMTALALGTSVHPRPAGLALIAPQPIRMLDLVALQLHQQLDAAVAAGQLTPAQRDTYAELITAAVKDIRSSRPVDVTGLPTAVGHLLQALQNPANARFVRTDDAVVPAALARRLRASTAVLLTCGTADTQVPCATTNALNTALRRAHTHGPGRITLTGVDHQQHDPTHPTTLAPGLTQALGRWLGTLRQ
ncbi:alpha/beta fold hydrolase [Streptomyces niveus]|uniref:alpha/beta hydrolase n=1 Tax=Streptomyces niveus TaxID=193462 RepID=UPI0036EA78E7